MLTRMQRHRADSVGIGAGFLKRHSHCFAEVVSRLGVAREHPDAAVLSGPVLAGGLHCRGRFARAGHALGNREATPVRQRVLDGLSLRELVHRALCELDVGLRLGNRDQSSPARERSATSQSV